MDGTLMKNIWDYICNNATIVMYLGRFVIFISILLSLSKVMGGTKLSSQSVPYPVIIAGVVLLVIGYIASHVKKNRKNKPDSEAK